MDNIQGFPKKKEVKNRGKCKCVSPVICQNGAQLGYERLFCNRCGKEPRKELSGEDEIRNIAIDECKSAVMKMLDKEKIEEIALKHSNLFKDNRNLTYEKIIHFLKNRTQAFIDYMKGGV